ncbi:MAG: methyl-accepting chemotaxis protein [Thermodesulfobacteriota bacterium]|nr:methyl-accepting chemotaxis protein [Thermodesulfobacteriota bacterium]
MRQNFKRRNFFIKKDFQGKYIFNSFLLVAFGSVLFALIFSFFSSNTLSIVYDNYHLQLGTTPGILLNKIFSAQWLFIVLGGFTVIGITLLLTHRIAGPFFRFEKTLDSMNKKDFTQQIYLRTKDEGKELAQKINLFNNEISSDIAKIKLNAEDINLYCKKINSAENHETDMDLLKSELKKIRVFNQNTLTILNDYKYIID